MHILAALDTPTTGTVTIGGQGVAGLTDREVTLLRREHIGFVFQFFNLLPMLTAEENVVLPLSIAGEKPEKDFFEDLLKRLGLSDRRNHRPAELSGGQQQRVAIARALVSRPTVVLADEPTGNLDSATSHEILELLRSATEDYGQTTVMVTHDAAAAAIAGRILFLSDGLIADERTRSEPAEILSVINQISA
jgi:putative ABC transport system ATP-binding protein